MDIPYKIQNFELDFSQNSHLAKYPKIFFMKFFFNLQRGASRRCRDLFGRNEQRRIRLRGKTVRRHVDDCSLTCAAPSRARDWRDGNLIRVGVVPATVLEVREASDAPEAACGGGIDIDSVHADGDFILIVAGMNRDRVISHDFVRIDGTAIVILGR